MNKLLVFIGMLVFSAAGFAQETKVATVDFERVVVGTAQGKKAQDAWNAKYQEHQKNLEARQKEIEDGQNKLKTQGNVLSDTVKADLAKEIERKTTELNRVSEDAQKEMEDLRTSLLRPISELAQQIAQQYAAEKGFTLVVDVSNPASSIVYLNKKADITDDIIKRVDEAKPAATTAAPAAATPATPRPAATPTPARTTPAPK